MLVRFSFIDILRIPEFSHLNQFDLLKHEMDSVVAPYLFHLGANIDKGIRVQACIHRSVDLSVLLGYTYVCLERSDKEWLADPRCSMSARIHNQPDRELQNDMVRMSVQSSGERGFKEMCVAAIGKDGTTRSMKKDESDTWQDDLNTLRILRDIQKEVRGYLHPDDDIFDDVDDLEQVVLQNFEVDTNNV